MIRPLGVIGLAVLVLQGCAELPLPWTETAPAGSSQQQAKAGEKGSPPVPERKPSEEVALKTDPSTGVETEGGEADVETLLGLDFESVRDLLGNPSLEEIKALATVWAYNGRGCVLSVFFFPHVDGGEYRALTYDVKGAEEDAGLSQRCFSELLRDRRKAEVN